MVSFVLFPICLIPIFDISTHFVTEILDFSFPSPSHFSHPTDYQVLLIQISVYLLNSYSSPVPASTSMLQSLITLYMDCCNRCQSLPWPSISYPQQSNLQNYFQEEHSKIQIWHIIFLHKICKQFPIP